jgi:hypothetical protein
VRVYVPATVPSLRALAEGRELAPAPIEAYAVTPGLRESYAEGDLEELEYAAMTEAARASLRLLAEADGAPPRRAVVAAEVPAAAVSARRGSVPAAVVVTAPVPLADVVSVHVDDDLAADDIRAAVAALPAAHAGDDDAQFTVDGAEGHELMWYATQELPDLVRD